MVIHGLRSFSINDWTPILESLVHIVLILIFSFILLRLSKKFTELVGRYLRSKTDEAEGLKRVETITRVMRYSFSVLVSIVTGMLVLGELGISVAPVLATAGVIGVALGFSAQNLVKDFLNGFFLVLENQVRRGDIVEVAGKSGLVEEITLRYIQLRDYDGNVHFIPNGQVTTVTNMSRGFAYSVIDIPVAYRENIDEVFKSLLQIGTELRKDSIIGAKILEDLELAGIDKLADSAVIVRCRFKVVPLEQWVVRREFYRRVKIHFDEERIEIPYPHLTVYAGVSKQGESSAFVVNSNHKAAEG
ncbi:MAG: mechanosensitive ion channel family protein [Pseudomonadota bacterium]|nr:mechanosensitive ion channel family protein [Pseudomonadota bacterium]